MFVHLAALYIGIVILILVKELLIKYYNQDDVRQETLCALQFVNRTSVPGCKSSQQTLMNFAFVYVLNLLLKAADHSAISIYNVHIYTGTA